MVIAGKDDRVVVVTKRLSGFSRKKEKWSAHSEKYSILKDDKWTGYSGKEWLNGLVLVEKRG